MISIPARVVDENVAVHMRAAQGGIPRGLPVEGGLDALADRGFRSVGDRQIDRMRREGETRVRPEGRT